MTRPKKNGSIGDIAIIGMACKFPGAGDVETFWQNLKNGVESVSFFTDEELAAAGVAPDLLANPAYVKARPVLNDTEMFDAEFFGISPREAESMDPQHRLFLETAWAALENSGYDSSRYPGAIGMYGGSYFDTYLLANLCTNRQRTESLLNQNQPGTYLTYLGNDKDYLTSRVAYKLDLRGPAVTVQTACSTSLVAIVQACQSLLYYQCDMALAGGIAVTSPQKKGYLYQEGGMTSPDGHCRPFDAQAQGTLFGSGVGLVVLKRLDEAISDRDHIYAVVKGSAINNDGAAKVSYTAPSINGQVEVIALAQALAGVDADTINYIEAHGTGTPLGDPIEVAALTQAFRQSTDLRGFCGIGSLKSNVGHLDVAAGVAGVIKTALALQHKLIPPTLHFSSPNPKIDFANSPFYVVTQPTEWKTNGTPRRAGVSAFGVGGTNAHVVMEETPDTETSGSSRNAQLLMLSAKTPEALNQMTVNLAAHLKIHPDINLADVAYTLQAGRRELPHRRIAACRDVADAVAQLEKPDPKRVFSQGHARRDPSVVFMFPGQGSQYFGMGAELYSSEHVFRTEVDRCAEFLLPILQTDLRTVMFSGSRESAEELLIQTRFTQPALFVLEYALAQLWMSWEVRPAAMIGHSVGEYVAACLAGVFSLEGALTLIAERARLVQEQPGGAMLAVQLPESEVVQMIEGNGQLAVAAINSPGLCVVAGPHDQIALLEKDLAAREIFVRRLHTSHAFHSPMMNPVLEPFTQVLRKVSFNAPQIPYVSNVTARWITAVEATDPQYWANHVRQAVRFADGIAQFMQDPATVLLEVGPGKTLSTLARQHPNRKLEQVVVNSLAKDEGIDSILTAYGRLWLAGVSADAETFFANERRSRLPLPTYPFERKRYWVEPDGSSSTALAIDSVNKLAMNAALNEPATRTAELKVLLTQLSGKDYSSAGDHVTFVELGLESLFLTQFSMAIARRFGVQVAFRQLLGDSQTESRSAVFAAHLGESAPPACLESPQSEPANTALQTAPLTEAQQEVWLATTMSDASSCVFNQSSALRLQGPLRRDILKDALSKLIQRHEGLRATFSSDGRFQTVAPTLPIDISFFNLSARPAQLDDLLAEEASRPFDLEHGPLIRVRVAQMGQHLHVVLLTVHHIVCDGRSLALLLHDLGELYSAGCEGQEANLPRAQSLMTYAVHETRQIDGTARQAAETYWLQQYSEHPPTLELPANFPRPAHKSFRGGLAKLELPSVLCGELKRAGAAQGCTPFTTLLAAYYALLHRLTGQEDIVVGVPFATPGIDSSQQLIGHTVNFLAMRDRIQGDLCWTQHLQEVKQLVLEAFEHRQVSYGGLTQKLSLAWDSSRIPLVAASFNLAQTRHPLRFAGLQAETEPNPHSFTNLDLTFDFNQDGEKLSLDCIYNTDLFDASTIQRWLGHFETLLKDIVSNPAKMLCKLSILTESERAEQIIEWNKTTVEIPEALTLHGWFESQVEKTPDATAVTFENRHLTYAELNGRANQLAQHLKKLGVGPDMLVGLLVERSLDMMVALFGVLKAGGAYVPLDPAFPRDRLAYMVEDSGMRVLITHRDLDKRLLKQPSEVVRLDADWGNISKQNNVGDASVSNPQNLAYVLFTSGSTGKPKGVEISHYAVTNFLSSMRHEPGFTSADRMLAVTTLSFDIAGLELYLPLISGGEVVIATGTDARDPALLLERIAGSSCTVMQATPATWRALVTAGWRGSPKLKVLCGGESLPRELAHELMSRCGELWNMYGPTETTIWSTVHRVVSTNVPIPIGRPIANTQVFVLDRNRDLVPTGAVGELYIGGAGLARGYSHRAELTAERFVQNPFRQSERLYRTGDLARQLPDGTVECLGRADSQIKIRGFRIELGEVETILASHEAIRQCTVLVREDVPGEKQLVAYYEVKAGSPPILSDLRAHLEKNLPAYMVPSIFVRVEDWPLTPNGKIDRKSLPAPAQSIEITSEFAAPNDPLEQLLAHIWREVLNVKRVGVQDNFFELGGHSLLAVRIVVEIERLCKIRLPLATFLQAPTIAALAAILHQKNWAPSWSSLVPIRPGGSKPPLFLMHSHGGNVLEYYPFGRLLEHDQPLYALQARGLDGRILKDLTLEGMASAYVEEVRSLQPEGPYFLGGFCFGGFLALEAAQQLTAAGQEVALVVMIQSMHPSAMRFKPGVTMVDRWRYRAKKRIHLELENLSHSGKAYVFEKCRRMWDRVRARTAIAFGGMHHNSSNDPSRLPMHHILEALAIEHGKAIDKYVPRPYGGDVFLFRAGEQLSGLVADESLGWKDTLSGNLDVCEIAGHQQNLLLEPHIFQLAKELSDRLKVTQERHGVTGSIHSASKPLAENVGEIVGVG